MPVATLIFAAPLSARLAERFGSKIVVALGLAVVAASLGLLSTVTAASSYGLIAASLAILGAGMGFTMTPATESIMGSLPLAKAGVGSAMNDTTRQVGGALGVAVLGSILASSYASSMASAVHGLSATAAGTATDSIGGAADVAGQLGGSQGSALLQASHAAFANGMGDALILAAVVAFVGALVALFFLPARARDPIVLETDEELPGRRRGRGGSMMAPAPPAATHATRPPGRPRNAQVDTTIQGAAIDLFVEQGFEAMSMEGRGGARRGRQDHHLPPVGFQRGPGDGRAGLQPHDHRGSGPGLAPRGSRAAHHGVPAGRGPHAARTCLPRMVAEVADGSAIGRLYSKRVIEPRTQMLRSIFQRGVDRGELPAGADLDLGIDLIMGPAMLRRLFGKVPVRGARALSERHVDVVLAGLANSH